MALLRRKTKKKLKRKAKKAAKRYWPLGVAGVVLSGIAAAWAVAPTSEWVAVIGQRVEQLGWGAPLIYFLLYIVGTLILVPSPVMVIAGGVAFGWWGLPLALIGETAGCACSFLLSRYFFGNTLEDWLTGHPMFRAVKHAIEEEGWRTLLLLRLSPAVPPSLLNYLLGLTNIPFGTYLIWSTIGNVPSTVVDTYIGVLGANAHDSAQLGFLVVGLIATIALVVLITIKAKGYLRKAGVKA
jgi:uncharacterized membrane protein YdjX (TVP38/TMEM64 family)